MRTVLLSAVIAPGVLLGAGAWAQEGVATGAYACWYFAGLRTHLNFTLIGDGRYEDDGGKSGTVRFNAKKSRLTFRGGALDREVAIYEERGGTPRVTFPRRRTEVTFCELTKR